MEGWLHEGAGLSERLSSQRTPRRRRNQASDESDKALLGMRYFYSAAFNLQPTFCKSASINIKI